MPFTDKHRAIIGPLLDLELDDLSTDPKKLESQLNEIKKALTVNPFALPTESKEQKNSSEQLKSQFYTLQRCYHAPEENLARLENMTGPVNVGEVQEGILHYVQTRVETAAKQATISLEWRPDSLIPNIPKTNKEKQFATVKQSQSDSLEIPTPPGMIYTITDVHQDPDTYIFYMNVQINFPDNTTMDIPRPIGYTNLRGEGSFSARFIARAQVAANQIAMDEAKKYLMDNQILDELEAEQIPEGTKKYLAYDFFFQKILKKELNIWDLYTHDEEEAHRVMNTVGVTLIESRLDDLNLFRQATDMQLKVMADLFFQDQFVKGVPVTHTTEGFDLADVVKLSDEECTNLTYLPIQILLRKGKISRAEAQAVTPLGRRLLGHQFFLDEVEQGRIQLSQLNSVTPFEADTLAMLNVQKLLAQGTIITLEQAKQFTLDQREILEFDKVVKLVVGKQATLEQAFKLSYRSVNLLENNSFLFDLVQLGIIPILDVNKILNGAVHLRPGHMTGQAALTLSSSQQDLFIKCIKDFMALAEQGILYSSDLNFLRVNFASIAEEIASQMSSDTKEQSPLILLKSKTILNRCLKNVINRFNRILIEDPLMMQDRELDNFSRVNKACTFISVNFVQIAFHELVSHMHGTYSHFGSLTIEEIVEHGAKFGFNKECMWGIAHAIRAYGIYQGLPCVVEHLTRDSMAHIKESLLDRLEVLHLSHTELFLHFVKYLQQLIREDLAECPELKTASALSYIHQTLIDLEQKTTGSLENQLQSRLNAMQKVFEAARTTLNTHRVEVYMPPNQTTHKKRPLEGKTENSSAKRSRLSIFDFNETDQPGHSGTLRKLCRGLLRLEPLLTKLVPSVALAPTEEMTHGDNGSKKWNASLGAR